MCAQRTNIGRSGISIVMYLIVTLRAINEYMRQIFLKITLSKRETEEKKIFRDATLITNIYIIMLLCITYIHQGELVLAGSLISLIHFYSGTLHRRIISILCLNAYSCYIYLESHLLRRITVADFSVSSKPLFF